MKHDTLRRIAAMAALAGLAACGGGGGGGTTPAPVSGPCANAASGAGHAIVTRTTTADGAGAGASVLGCSGAIGDPQWTQTAGPAVTLYAAKTQTIHFEPPFSGTYAFRVDFTDPAGTRRSEVATIDIAPSAAVRLALRNSQSVRMGGNVSVRAWPQLGSGDAVQSIAWAQVEGPAVTLNTSDSHVALFVAPTVTQDTIIRLRATLRTTAGVTAVDEAQVLVERHVQAAASDAPAVWGGSHVSRVYAYRPNGPYANALQRCVYDVALRDDGITSTLCPIATLPFLAQETGGAVPTVAQVMNRVVVSNDWLGARFEEFLNNHDSAGDFRRMMNSVTAIVLGTQVRPSFYYAVTGAIYLDADNLWRFPEERDTVNEAPDFRSDFDRDLGYSGVWRYVLNNQSIFTPFSSRARVARTSVDVRNDAAWLMYHELGHALDFLPPSLYASLNSNTARDPWDVIGPRFNARQLTSDTVSAAYPLQSSIMAGLGQVKFQGATATPTQRGYAPTDVASFFGADRATDEYAYSTSREDIAMTLEEVLMANRLGIRRDVAITDKIGPTTTGSTLIVRWGQRGRVGNAAIKPRARSIATQLVPWFDPNQVDTMPAPMPMRAGDSWTSNLVLPARPGPFAEKSTEPEWMADWKVQAQMKRLRHHQHVGRPALPMR